MENLTDVWGPKVYLLKSESDQGTAFKIGFTSQQLSKRIKQLQTGSPHKLVAESLYPSPRAAAIEKALQRRFSYRKTHGEWFDLTLEEAMSFQDECARLDGVLEVVEDKYNGYNY